MLRPSWANFEASVGSFASRIWLADAAPERIAGVAIDCVVRVNPQLVILVEATERRDVNKVREDVAKLVTAKNHLFNVEHVFARCYCVVDCETVTSAMREAGAAQKIEVLSFRQFCQMFFSFDSYSNVRKARQFGSAVDPATGLSDELPYVSVKYAIAGSERSLNIHEIADLLIDGTHVVLIGDYGSGKSRCVRELFYRLCELQAKNHTYPVAIDLRHNWGLKRYSEIIRRHCDDLGLDGVASEILRSFPTGAFIFLLDGFDELGSQAWSTDTDKLRAIRAQSLEGVKDLIQNHQGGLLITGRAHYFNNDEEMYLALGLAKNSTDVIYCKEEFDATELTQYFSSLHQQLDLPDWLPRKPLICKTIAALEPDSMARMFAEEGGDVEFWHHFMDVLCKRDVRIHAALDSGALYNLLRVLARLTRTKPADVGPLSLSEIQNAFESVVGQAPVEQASQMLQRLPGLGLGRIRAESDDRQFIDMYILDGLRAVDLLECVASFPPDVPKAAWRNPLDRLGQRIFAEGVRTKEKLALQYATRCASDNNRVLASDIVASLTWGEADEFDYKDFALDDGHFILFDMSRTRIKNIRITNTTFSNFVFPNEQPVRVFVGQSIIDSAYGVTSERGLPEWFKDSTVEKFESAENISRIRQIGLKPSHEILVAVIRKTFFQKGGGRKEEALVRGLGRVAGAGFPSRILNLLMTEGILTKFKGDEGWVYTPERQHTTRMAKLVAELNLSKDPIWVQVGNL